MDGATISGKSQRATAGRCDAYPVEYALNLPENASTWNAEISAMPRGRFGEGGTAGFGDYSAAPTGIRRMRLCIYDKSDLTVDLEVTGHYFLAGDGLPACGGRVSGKGVLRLKPGRTRTTFSVSTTRPRFNQVVRLGAQTQSLGSDGWGRFGNTDVELQVRAGSRWVSGKGAEFYTGTDGKATLAYRWTTRRTIELRLVTPAQGAGQRSVSKVITINPRD